MKKIILLLTLCCSIIHLYAQNDKKNLIGTHVALGIGDYGAFGKKGGGSYDVKRYYTIGLDYSRQISKRFDFCSGFEYTYSNMTATPHSSVEGYSPKAHLTMTTIPAQLRYHFGKFVYLNGGLLFNITARMNNIWPTEDKKTNVDLLLGLGLGVGFKYEFKSGIMLFLNPYVRYNGIGNDYKYAQIGGSFGVGFKF